MKMPAAVVFILASWGAAAAWAAGETVTYKVGGERVRAYVAKPAEPGDGPGIVIVHHFWGLDAHTLDVADRFARLGYAAVAPDLYRGRLGADFGLAQEMMLKLDEPRAIAIVKGTIAYLRGPGGAGPKPVALVGFGMGGRVALATALQAADVQALVIFYGHVETTPEAVRPLKVPVLGVFGTDDRAVPAAEAKQFDAALKAAGKEATIIIYRGVAHAFFDDTRADHDPEMSMDAWVRTTDYLAKTFGPLQAQQPGRAPPPPAGASSPPGRILGQAPSRR